MRRVEADAVDGLVAVALSAGACVGIALGAHHPPAVFVSGLIVTASVAWRRRAPIAAAMAALGGLAAFGSVATGPNPVVLAALALVSFSLGQQAAASRRDLWVAAVLLAASVATAVFTPGELSRLDEASGWALFVAVPSIIGNALARRSLMVASLDRVTRQLREENETIAARAAGGERLRIARELHDIVAHRVSVMVIHTAAARRVAGTDPDLASESLRLVEHGGREALIEMRRVIGLLRGDGDLPSGPGAHRGLGQIGALVDQARSSGLEVVVKVRGLQRALAPELDSVAFRVVQEALTNTLKHAGQVKAEVTLAYREQEFDVEIIDSGPVRGPAPAQCGGGFGLTGMQERLALHGGRLEAGRDPAGGFRVHAWLPIHQAALV